ITNPPAWRRFGVEGPIGFFVAGGQPFLFQTDWTATIPVGIGSDAFWGPVRTSGSCGSCSPRILPAAAIASLQVDEKTACMYAVGGSYWGTTYAQVVTYCAAADGFLGGPPAQAI